MGINLLNELIWDLDLGPVFPEKEDIKDLFYDAGLYPRDRESHKGDYGKVLVVAGSEGMAGAAILAAKAALRAGAGLCTVLAESATIPVIQTAIPEATCINRDDLLLDMDPLMPEGMESPYDYFMESINNYRAIVFGPGLGMGPDMVKFIDDICYHFTGTLVLDADGINTVSQYSELLFSIEAARCSIVITPHAGEAERLMEACEFNQANSLSSLIDEVEDYPEDQELEDNRDSRMMLMREAYEREGAFKEITEEAMDRMDTAVELALRLRTPGSSEKSMVAAVVKGANTAIAVNDGRLQYFFNTTGNPGMATGGSGDTLSGIIGGLAAQGMTAGEAAIAGVYLHGLAGDLAARELSQFSLMAGDISNYLGKAYLSLFA